MPMSHRQHTNAERNTPISDRLSAIRARVDDSAPITLSGPPALVAAFEQKDADIAWLLEQVDELTKRVRMYEVVKS